MGTSYLLNTPKDRSGLIVIFAAVGVSWSITVLVTRLSGSISRRRGWGLEDWSIIASTCTGVASSIAIFAAVGNGLGRERVLQSLDSTLAFAKALFAAEILYILALAFSKLATLQLISVLSPARSHRRTCQAVSGFTVVWAVGAVFVIALRCGLPILWRSVAGNQCGHMFARWAVVEAISLLIECLIFGIAVAMIQILQMPRKKKVKAMLAFSVRLPVIIPTTLRLLYFQTPSEANDYSLGATGLVIATQCAMHYSVMSASFSYLQPFLAAFDSNLGASTKLDTVVASRSSERRKGTGASISRGHTTASVQRNAEPSHLTKRPSSEDSKAPIIMKTASYRVEVEA